MACYLGLIDMEKWQMLHAERHGNQGINSSIAEVEKYVSKQVRRGQDMGMHE